MKRIIEKYFDFTIEITFKSSPYDWRIHFRNDRNWKAAELGPISISYTKFTIE